MGGAWGSPGGEGPARGGSGAALVLHPHALGTPSPTSLGEGPEHTSLGGGEEMQWVRNSLGTSRPWLNIEARPLPQPSLQAARPDKPRWPRPAPSGLTPPPSSSETPREKAWPPTGVPELRFEQKQLGLMAEWG